MVLIEVSKIPADALGPDGRIVWEAEYTLHLRRCCRSRFGSDPARTGFDELGFLSQHGAMRTHPYFRYGDLRDQGYLATVRQDIRGSWVAKDSLTQYKALEVVAFDLNSLVDSMDG